MGVRPGMGIKGALRDRALEENGNNYRKKPLE